MVLSQTAIRKINTKHIRLQLALALNCTEVTIIRYLRNNDDNLTKAAVIQIIKRETGLDESEILAEKNFQRDWGHNILPESEFYNTL